MPNDGSKLRLSIQYVKGVGPRTARLLERLGIRTPYDALYYFPARYEDRASQTRIADLTPGALQSITGTVQNVALIAPQQTSFRGGRRGGGKFTIVEVAVTDGTGAVKAKWFNQPFMEKRFTKGMQVTMSGMVKATRWGIEIDNPDCEVIAEEGDDQRVHTARIVPVYSVTEGLGVRQLRALIAKVIDLYLNEIQDPIPEEIRKRNGLPALQDCIRFCHFPPEGAQIDALNSWQSPEQRALSFHELFYFELGVAAMKKDYIREQGIAFKPSGALTSRLRESLPFTLTGAQERALDAIGADMRSPHPMNRLLQGDVGSGKTIVALMALLAAVECGYQAALMAPTEILAGQHYINLHRMVEALGVRITLITGGRKLKKQIEDIATGEVDIIVGTHALIQEGLQFKALGLAVIDEQHRFGVMQRAVLRKKGANPDILIMTATPIPRTLALTLYGDLDYTVIRELPPGRTPVKTLLYWQEQKAIVYDEIKTEVGSGGQAYVVYPLIEEQVLDEDAPDEKQKLKSAEEGFIGLQKLFPEFRISLIHGKMKPAEREAAMAAFKAGEIDVLVATTVIEVGVDVPNASLMVIVHAERFGLSQLHQLRGRVGRGRRASRCILLDYGHPGGKSQRRLDAMVRTTDGFEIAEDDLDIRGPGEFMGTRQSGVPDLRVAHLVRDAVLIEPAREEAFRLAAQDPMLEKHPALRAAAEGFWQGKMELYKTG